MLLKAAWVPTIRSSVKFAIWLTALGSGYVSVIMFIARSISPCCFLVKSSSPAIHWLKSDYEPSRIVEAKPPAAVWAGFSVNLSLG
jgi:hypothetical protein